ncbi:MAG: hypothetical protein HY261_00425 [Chloroflexi bacterium]|nr:hypothetical protein [Chloroflexota bacterium]
MAQEQLASDRVQVTADAIEFYYEKGWTDGLPVVPATEARVREFLAHGGKHPSDVIGVVPTRGRVITAEKVAINAVMAGCKPEYMPVVLAAVEAMCEPPFNWHGCLASTGGSAVFMIVNGPITRHLGINGGVNCFGPGFRANATIGRAIRLIIINVTGGVPGVLDKSTFGHGGKYSMCIAENEDASPWEPLHVERGLKPNDSAVTVLAVHPPLQFADQISNKPEEMLASCADNMAVYGPNLGEVVIAWSPEHVRVFREAKWPKRRGAEWLAERATISLSKLQKYTSESPSVSKQVVKGPEAIVQIVAGGDAGIFSCIVPPWGGGHMSKSVTKKIQG